MLSLQSKESLKKINVTYTKSLSVTCAGEDGNLGHPLVYLEISKELQVVCPYCTKKFIYKP